VSRSVITQSRGSANRTYSCRPALACVSCRTTASRSSLTDASRPRPFPTLLIHNLRQTGSSGARSSWARMGYSLLAPNLTAE
jgi:hypothetical protein